MSDGVKNYVLGGVGASGNRWYQRDPQEMMWSLLVSLPLNKTCRLALLTVNSRCLPQEEQEVPAPAEEVEVVEVRWNV